MLKKFSKHHCNGSKALSMYLVTCDEFAFEFCDGSQHAALGTKSAQYAVETVRLCQTTQIMYSSNCCTWLGACSEC